MIKGMAIYSYVNKREFFINGRCFLPSSKADRIIVNMIFRRNKDIMLEEKRKQQQQQTQAKQKKQDLEGQKQLKRQQKQPELRPSSQIHHVCRRSSLSYQLLHCRMMIKFLFLTVVYFMEGDWYHHTNIVGFVQANNERMTLSMHHMKSRRNQEYNNVFFGGDTSCPCLTNLDDYPISRYEIRRAMPALGRGTNYSTYGLGCAAHDTKTPQCVLPAECLIRDDDDNDDDDAGGEQQENQTTMISSLFCDYSWCQRQFCYVDPNNCNISKRVSPMFPNRYYSYATCYYADTNVDDHRFASIQNTTVRIALNSNTGGWKGAYNNNKSQFDTNISDWSGPIVDFIKTASILGQFSYELVPAETLLQNLSNAYFASNSSFDFCVYMNSLGYTDLCIAQYTITELRGLTTEWILTDSHFLYMFIVDNKYYTKYYQEAVASLPTIFSPFTKGAWMFLLFFVIPIFSFLMVIHEKGIAGSTFPSNETVVVTLRGGQTMVQKRTIPYWKTIMTAFYITSLAVLQGSYEQSIITVGAMLNLLGLSFFILTIIAVYTANLAAILTQNVNKLPINDIHDAIATGYRFCAERQNMEAVTDLYPNINQNNQFAIDPIDNLPGFASRARVFDMIDPKLAQYDTRYCHAGIAPFEDLESLQQKSIHCNKTQLGTGIRSVPFGIPINGLKVPSLSSFLNKLQNQGYYDRALLNHVPQPRCKSANNNINTMNMNNLNPMQTNYNAALNISQLSGIWFICFGFAVLGLLYTLTEWYYKKYKASYSVEYVHRFNQRGVRINVYDEDPKWVKEKLNECRRISRFSRMLSAEEESAKRSVEGQLNPFSALRFNGLSNFKSFGFNGSDDRNISNEDNCSNDGNAVVTKGRRSNRNIVGFRGIIMDEMNGDSSLHDSHSKARMAKLNRIVLGFDEDDHTNEDGSEELFRLTEFDDEENQNHNRNQNYDDMNQYSSGTIVFDSTKQSLQLTTIYEDDMSNSDFGASEEFHTKGLLTTEK